MMLVPMDSKIRKADDKLHPLFAIVDSHGHTVVQTTDYKMAQKLIDEL
jgi:hypothetical protein